MSEQGGAGNDALWTPGRIIATAVVVTLVATIGYTLLSGSHSEGVKSNVVLPGTPASVAASKIMPADFDVPTFDGGTMRLSSYHGKVLVLDFWATWCPPCRKGIPQLVRIANQNRARGVEVVGLHIDDKGRSTPEQIRAFIRQFGINYPVGMAGNDMFIQYLGEKETAIPQTLVFDRSGQVIEHLIGYTDSDARRLDEAVNRALAGS